MSTTRRLLSMALVALGDTADDVADLLIVGGWTGLRDDPCSCPVATYLKAVVSDTATVAVSVNGISVITDDDHVHVTTPPGPAAFIAAFDSGAYDELAVTRVDDNGDAIDELER